MVNKVTKKKVNGKAKGNGFENKVAKMLTAALDPLKFRRSQQSGAMVGGQNSVFMENYSKLTLALFTGDVVPTNECADGNPRFRFVVECKFYKDHEKLEHLFTNSKIYGWLQEAVTDAVKVDKTGILIFKFNGTGIFACVESTTELPEGIKYLTLLNGEKVCYFEELLAQKTWWIE